MRPGRERPGCLLGCIRLRGGAGASMRPGRERPGCPGSRGQALLGPPRFNEAGARTPRMRRRSRSRGPRPCSFNEAGARTPRMPPHCTTPCLPRQIQGSFERSENFGLRALIRAPASPKCISRVPQYQWVTEFRAAPGIPASPTRSNRSGEMIHPVRGVDHPRSSRPAIQLRHTTTASRTMDE